MTGFDGIPVVSVDWMPPGTMLVGANPPVLEYLDVRPRVQWDPPPDGFDPTYARERARGLSFVADLLDGLCADFGMDPDTTWRGPHNAEVAERLRLRNLMAHAVEARLSLALHRPGGFTIITGI